ncbi:MAG TPA: MerR family transcriptional regulator [Gemmatimonadales bacterium]|nr:MerR family transcriptional regulator [Gemmatimonadales bacterium]
MQTLTIGQLAGAAGVNVQTVRYYERRGLLDEPPRRPSGYREYPESDVARLGFIRRAQALGFTLKEIKELLQLRMAPDTTPGQVRSRVDTKIADVDEKIAELERIRGALRKMSASCEVHGPLGDCPFLEALESQSEAA